MTDLCSALAHRRWIRHTDPFPHVAARDVFVPEIHDAMTGQIEALLEQGLMDQPSPGRFSRSMRGYDAYGLGFPAGTPGPVGLFLTREWRDLMCNLFDVAPTPYMFAGAHHHSIGGRDGFI